MKKETREVFFRRISTNSHPKDRAFAETMTRFIGLLFLYVFSVFWNGLFFREGTNTLGWIIYFIVAIILFVLFVKLLISFFRKLVVFIKLLRSK